jgi:8-oxo-dGTP pyrophosphatase MutT (NUDIX family)
VAALPWRRDGDRLEICVVTTRETHRWTIPKGWPMKDLSAAAAARIEAEQEAGVSGTIEEEPCGSYLYWKRGAARFDLIRVEVFPLRVTRTLADWKEKGQRRIRWLAADAAAALVEEPELVELIDRFRTTVDPATAATKR